MKTAVLLALAPAAAMLLLGCSTKTQQNEVSALMEQAKALGLITTKADAAAAGYRGPVDNSRLFVLTKKESELAKRVAKFAPGGDARAVGASLKSLGSAVNQLENAAAKGTLPIGGDWSHPMEMVFPELPRMKDAAEFFCGRAEYRAQSADLDGSFADLRRVAAIHRQTTGERFLIGKLVSTRIAALGERAIARVAGHCHEDQKRLAQLQEIAAAFKDVDYKESLGYEIIIAMDGLDLIAADPRGVSSGDSKDSLRVVEAARINLLKRYIDMARKWPDLKSLGNIDGVDAEVNKTVSVFLIASDSAAAASIAQRARREMTGIGLGILRKRSESKRWDLSLISTSADPFKGTPYKYVSTPKSLRIYSPGTASTPDREVVGFDYRDR